MKPVITQIIEEIEGNVESNIPEKPNAMPIMRIQVLSNIPIL